VFFTVRACAALRFAGIERSETSTAGIAALNPENPHGYDGPDHG